MTTRHVNQPNYQPTTGTLVLNAALSSCAFFATIAAAPLSVAFTLVLAATMWCLCWLALHAMHRRAWQAGYMARGESFQVGQLRKEVTQLKQQLASQPIRVVNLNREYRATLRETESPEHKRTVTSCPPLVHKHINDLAIEYGNRDSDALSFRLLKDAGYSRAESKMTIKWMIDNCFAEYRHTTKGTRAFVTPQGESWLSDLVTVEGEIVD